MRIVLVLLAVLVASAGAQQPAISWEPTGGPPVPKRTEIVTAVMNVATAPWGGVFVADGYGFFVSRDDGGWQKVVVSQEPGLAFNDAYAVTVTSRGDVL